ncbi:hypothetical protein KSP39_PZI016357 [Platanthera zijinensis]|uniref:MULE transposase domain-containing protein n=1 Tax=Platanthera zijinensis TaxID=2320716 RepID=A0AAP0B7L3_9ASPA
MATSTVGAMVQKSPVSLSRWRSSSSHGRNKRRLSASIRCATLNDLIGSDLLRPDLGRWLEDVEKHKALVVYSPNEGGYEGRYLTRLCYQGYYFLDLSARDLGDPESTLIKIHPICPGYSREDNNEWKIEVIYGYHNHGFVHLEAHPYISRLDENEQKIIAEMFNAGVKPRKILSALKKRNPENTTTIRTIYNEKAKLYRNQLDGGTPIQYLFKCISDSGYISFNQVHPETNQLDRIFFAHPTSVRLSNMFSNVFLIDCTYKTNRYRLPLLCIVGVTSMNQSFFSSFAFMPNETEASYLWALQCFKFMFEENVLPTIFVTDREIALMNAIKVEFPHAKNLLCNVHINRNILAHCKKYFKHGKECDKYFGVWQNLINSPTESEFDLRYNEMLKAYGEKYPNVLFYVTTTWIVPYKELFISSWVDKYLHLGNTMTNRVEEAA